MKILSHALLILLLILVAINCQANPASQDLIQLLQPTGSMQAKFIQTILDNANKPIARLEGNMALQRPGHFRWEVVSPIHQIIIVDKTKLWIYDPSIKQLLIRPAQSIFGGTPAFLLTNVNLLGKEFSVTRITSPKNWQWFAVTPKRKEKMFDTIQVGFFNHQLNELRMQDGLGHNLVVRFSQVRTQTSLPKNLFKLTVPANVDVVDQTRNYR